MASNKSISLRAIEELVSAQNLHAQLNRKFVKDELHKLLEQNRQKFESIEVCLIVYTRWVWMCKNNFQYIYEGYDYLTQAD